MARRTRIAVLLIRRSRALLWPAALLLLAATLAACGGTSVRQKPLPIGTIAPIATTSDRSVSVSLDTLIVRDGPGSWARNADWDEYRLTVRNLSDARLVVDRIVIFDAFDQPIAATGSRENLVRGSRKIARRHEDAGIEIKAGAGAATAASGLLLAGPALITTGIVRGVRNARVNEQLVTRGTSLPLHVAAGEESALQLFFPIVPSPERMVLSYRNGVFARQIVIDTSSVLNRLHLANAAEEL